MYTLFSVTGEQRWFSVAESMVDQLRIRRLKKRKLLLKDMIMNLESELIPDLDA